MNYFDFYEIPISFLPDEEEIKKKFYENSKKYHPDFYINENAEKQNEILNLATFNTNAFNVLSSLDKRIEYILQLYQLIHDSEKYTLPQDFLMEMMIINEEVMEAKSDADKEKMHKIRSEVAIIETQLNEELLHALKEFDGKKEEFRHEELLKIKDIYYRKKYLLRIKDSLNKFVPLS